MPLTDALQLTDPYLETLGRGFQSGRAPDGTLVLKTPFYYGTGDPLEISAWEESGELVLSDRGGLVSALVLMGVDALESDIRRGHIRDAVSRHGAHLEDATVIMPVAGAEPGPAVQALVQSLMDAQTAAEAWSSRTEPDLEPQSYAVVRAALDEGRARYRENMHVSGKLGRRYAVDFELAFQTHELIRAILVVARDRTLEFAERWNFRFRDIRAARPRLHRLLVVDDAASWSDDAQKTIETECEGLFPPGEAGRLGEYLKEATPASL